MQYTPTSKMPLWIHAIAALFLMLFLALASWQANRGYSKQQLIDSIRASSSNPSITNEQLTTDDIIQTYQNGQPVTLTGELDNKRYFLIENQMIRGKNGFYVIQPLKISDDQHILVNRGWIPKPSRNQGTISIAPINKIVTIEGDLYEPIHNVFITRNITENHWPQRALEINFKEFETRLGYTLVHKLVRCQSDSEICFMAPPTLESWLTPERHFGYTFQWLSFALILSGIWAAKQFGIWRRKND